MGFHKELFLKTCFLNQIQHKTIRAPTVTTAAQWFTFKSRGMVITVQMGFHFLNL